ncbi:MAG: flagellar biosynthesis protein FlhB [Candidimonas sp.]|nr:MAG: flagellar biosynthesis protein FlhB [Candidimonas sp.]
MAENSDVEKTEPASHQRLDKARSEGQVPRSRELGTCLAIFGCGAVLWASASLLWEKTIGVMRDGLTFDAASAADPGHMFHVLGVAAVAAVEAAAPVLIAAAVAGVVGALALGGWLFTPAALAPKAERLNPISGAARFFSAQTGAELAKTLLKSVLIGALGYLALKRALPQLVALSNEAFVPASVHALSLALACCLAASAPIVLIALFDAPWQAHSYAKRLRMTKDEVRRELKENEGDPHVKGRIRQQQREIARHRMMSEVAKANVVVTNPTHFAVALVYAPGQPAPRLVAKGRGAVAMKIRELAAQHRVPVLEAPPLARALYAHVELGDTIPEALFAAVARVLAWVYQLRRWESGLEPAAPDNPEPEALAVPLGFDPGPARADAAAVPS